MSWVWQWAECMLLLDGAEYGSQAEPTELWTPARCVMRDFFIIWKQRYFQKKLFHVMREILK
jgi:hypothetical protein